MDNSSEASQDNDNVILPHDDEDDYEKINALREQQRLQNIRSVNQYYAKKLKEEKNDEYDCYLYPG